jgi:hypothetical protein
MLKHGCAVTFAAVSPFVKQHPGPGIGKQPAEIDLAVCERIPASILAGQLNQIEGRPPTVAA